VVGVNFQDKDQPAKRFLTQFGHSAGFRIMPSGLSAAMFFRRERPDRPLIDPA
jgi:hypothetical protein